MGLFKRKINSRISAPVTQPQSRRAFGILDGYVPLGAPQTKLYYALREAVPVIDAAIFKIMFPSAATVRGCRLLSQAILNSF